MLCVLNLRARFLICCSRPYYKGIRPSLVNSNRMREGNISELFLALLHYMIFLYSMLNHSSLLAQKTGLLTLKRIIKVTKQSKWLQSHYRTVWLLFPQSDSNNWKTHKRCAVVGKFLGICSHLARTHTFAEQTLDAFIYSCLSFFL